MVKIALSAVVNSHEDGTKPDNPKAIFVFGSNTAGQHWGGAAKAAAEHYGAKWGVAYGPTGKAYAVPTVEVELDEDDKELDRRTLTVDEIKYYAKKFMAYAKANPKKEFFMTRLGCAIAGHKDKDIAPLFAPALANINYPEEWVKFVSKK